MSKSETMRARRIEMLCAAAVCVAISRPATGQEQQPLQQQPQQQQPQQQQPQQQQPQQQQPQQQQQPPLPPVTIQAPKVQGAATKPSAGQGGKHRLTRQQRRERERANAAAAAAAAAAAQQAAAAAAYQTREGSEAQGYKPSTVTNFGPFGQVPLLDVPYSVNVISSDLIENIVGANVQDALNLSPVVQVTTPPGRDIVAQFNLRGFSAATVSIDGLRMGTYKVIPVEDKESVEVYTGLTSFLFGGTDVGGMVNFVYKKPTDTPIANVTVGDYGYEAGYVHADLGGPIPIKNFDYGTFGYRLNLVEQHGDLPISPQGEDRQLATAVVDWHVMPTTTVEIIGSHQYSDLHGWGAAFNSETNANGSDKFCYCIVPSPTSTFSPPWTSYNVEDDRGEINLKSKLNDIFTTRLAYAYESIGGSPYYEPVNTLTDNTGDYSTLIYSMEPTDYALQSQYAFLDANFNTGPIEHKITTGYYGNQTSQLRISGSNNTQTYTGFNFITGPYYPASPPILTPTAGSASYFGTRYLSSYAVQTNFVLGDEIEFNKYISALVGANYATIDTTSYNGTPPFAEAANGNVDDSKLSPMASLIFKPISWVSTYVTYSQALQAGGYAPTAANYTNSGQVLPPYVSNEYELGVKADVHGVLLTAALFDLKKANEYAQANPNGTYTEVEDGREEHKGIELTATGNLYEGLRVLGGVTLMDARVLQTSSLTLDDKYPVSVADQMAKATIEYDLPFLRGLTLTGGVYYTGRQAADALNTQWLPAYVTENLGFRYKYRLPTGHEAIFRLNVTNLTNQAYWMAGPNVGPPRVIAFSTQFKW